MLAHVVGIFLAMAAAAVTGGRLAATWSAPRLDLMKGAVLGPAAAAPTAALMQALGGGVPAFTPLGQIDWPPVTAALMSGAICGLIAVGAVGLIRLGSRRPFG